MFPFEVEVTSSGFPLERMEPMEVIRVGITNTHISCGVVPRSGSDDLEAERT